MLDMALMSEEYQRRLKEVELTIRTVSWDEIDVDAISHFTHKYGRGIYSNSRDVEGIRRYLSRIESRFPSEAIFLALNGDQLMGWAALDRNGETMAELGRWQPILRESEYQDDVAVALLQSIFEYAKGSGI